ncbi:aspartic peptidase domain-containing protein [Microdochium trichocladiopsis]|uniref:Aspartic peptidase domain-containing protein n=1 Tax=Microdochium trichocladiopsis TaxID=1682393 RepID=A0A9P9BT43_9PEZI|nr:aspartic peptidase domain-containing protein [Microdochium trichocladiopsis]KAH7039581.1 aspartic peptidase domain-containing protein [Microdochium trichocladiopsis]
MSPSVDAAASNTFYKHTGMHGNYSNPGTDETLNFELFEDSFSFGDIALKNFSMGLSDVTTKGIGYLGLSLPEPNIVNEYLNSSSTSALVDQYLSYWMVQNASVVTPAFSIWPGDGDKYSGKLVLGGIDTTKYTGELVSVEMYNLTFFLEAMHLALTHVVANSSSGTDELAADLPVALALDYGTPMSIFPHNLAVELWKIVGATYLPDKSVPAVPCGAANANAQLDLTFGGAGGAVVSAFMSDLVLPQSIMDLGKQDAQGQPLCVFQIRNHTDPTWFSMGNCLLQSTYLVADLHNRKLALGQAVIKPEVASTSQIVPFAARRAGIPSATPAPSPVPKDVLPFFSSELLTQSTRSQIPTSTPNPSTTYAAQAGFTDPASWTANMTSADGDSDGLAQSAQIGIGVGVGVAVVLLVAVAVLFFRRHRQKKQQLQAFNNSNSAAANGSPSTMATSAYGEGKPDMQTNAPPTELGGQQLQPELATWHNNQELPGDTAGGTGYGYQGSPPPQHMYYPGPQPQQPYQHPPVELDSTIPTHRQ